MVREMHVADIPAVHAIRLRVRENRLSDPSVVTEQHYHEFMSRDTKSWVHEAGGTITGFIMVDVEKRNLWALFVAPGHEFKGIGRALHEVMLAWYFTCADVLRLSTARYTRAETFYLNAGYMPEGLSPSGEVILALRRVN